MVTLLYYGTAEVFETLKFAFSTRLPTKVIELLWKICQIGDSTGGSS